MAISGAVTGDGRLARAQILIIAAGFLMVATQIGVAADADLPPSNFWVQFDSFTYRGEDSAAASVDPGKQYLNPILAGFYPDPSICRVGENYYLVNSSFAYFPGVPIFQSKDLVSWKQIGNIMNRPEEMKLEGQPVQAGIYAPAIRFHDGLFYMVSTLIGGGGNFYVTAKDPAGPWSEPHWLKKVDGIDPSFFFDDDGHVYLVHNGAPPNNKPAYEGHRAIWLWEFDLKSGDVVGDAKIIVNGGTDISKKPIWIEGPHIFRRNDFYYLIAAEGGTGDQHSEVVFRSKSVWGPWTPFEGNPILTQRGLKRDRNNPITCTGHADFVETQNGQWWAVFLGCQPYERGLFNTGRQTFMLPVKWVGDWPTILPKDEAVPRVVDRPDLPAQPAANFPLNGTFEWKTKFDQPALSDEWVFLRTPREQWYSLKDKPGSLLMAPRDVALSSKGNPSFIGRRQQQMDFEVSTAISVNADTIQSDAGLAAFQNETHYLFLGAHLNGGIARQVFVEELSSRGRASTRPGAAVIAEADLPADAKGVELKIQGKGKLYSFFYRIGNNNNWVELKSDVDGSILSTDIAGGFQGVVLGMYARK